MRLEIDKSATDFRAVRSKTELVRELCQRARFKMDQPIDRINDPSRPDILILQQDNI
jgi:hypothetical protein